MKMKLTAAFLALIAGFLFGVIFFINKIDNKLSTVVVGEVSVQGKSVSGMTKEELQIYVTGLVNDLNKEKVSIIMSSQKKSFTWNQLGVKYEDNKIVDKVFQRQNKSGIEAITYYMKSEPASFVIEPTFDEKKFEETFEGVFPSVVKKPVNAELKIEGEKIKITGGDNGTAVDMLSFKEKILDANLKNKKEVTVPLKEIEPEISISDIKNMGVNEVIGTYTTHFSASDKNKVNNIKLSSNTINGTLLAPGETFSFNGIVGRTTYAKGYKDGKAFVGGKIVDDVGGGICQVSSTIYNAALYAGMTITERHNHGMPVSYVPLGRDATLWYGSKDLKFKNTSDKYVYVQINTTSTSITVNIFGTKGIYDYVIESDVTERLEIPVKVIQDSSLPAGKEIIEANGAYGYKAVAYLIKKKDGKVISRTKLSNDRYKPMERTVRVGTAKIETATEPTDGEM